MQLEVWLGKLFPAAALSHRCIFVFLLCNYRPLSENVRFQFAYAIVGLFFTKINCFCYITFVKLYSRPTLASSGMWNGGPLEFYFFIRCFKNQLRKWASGSPLFILWEGNPIKMLFRLSFSISVQGVTQKIVGIFSIARVKLSPLFFVFVLVSACAWCRALPSKLST